MAGQHASRTTPHQRGGRRRTAKPPPNVACNSIGRRFNQVRKRCNSNAANSRFEMVTRELHAKLVGYSAIRGHKNWGEVGMAWHHTPSATSKESAGGAAGPGRASSRRAERSSRRGRRAGGRARRRPEHRWRSHQEHLWRSSNPGMREARRRVAASGPLQTHLSLMRSSHVRRSPTRMPKSRFWSAMAASVAGFLMRAASTSGAAVMAPTP